MNTIHFDQLFQDMKNAIEPVAKEEVKDYVIEAKKDGQQALENIKQNLQHWIEEVENGAMTYEDLAFLLKGEDGLSEMITLKEAGLSAVHIDKFENGLINMIIGTLTSVVRI